MAGLPHYTLVLWVLMALAGISLQNCFFPSGTDYLNTTYSPNDFKPCHSGVSMCCVPADGDTCTDQGICNYTSSSGAPVYYRGLCTDSTWQDPSCLKIFVNGSDPTLLSLNSQSSSNNTISMTRCGDNNWCQGSNNTDCCSKKQGLAIIGGVAVPATALPSTTSAASTGAASTSATASSTTTPTSSVAAAPSTSNNHTGAIAGGVVGGLVGALALVSILWLILRRKNRKAMRDSTGTLPEPTRRGHMSFIQDVNMQRPNFGNMSFIQEARTPNHHGLEQNPALG